MKKLIAVLLSIVMLVTCMMPVSAATNNFVASAEIKPAPGLVEQTTKDGTPAYGVITMPDGTQIPVPESAIIITPISQKDNASPSTKEALEKAYEALVNADSLEDLVKGLQDVLGNIDVNDLVVTDLFHIDLTGDYRDYIEKGGTLTIVLDVTNDIVAALLNADGIWSSIFGNLLVDNGDGTYTLTISKLGVIALLKNVVSAKVDYDDPAVASPKTGDMMMVYMAAGVVLALTAVAAFVVAKKKTA